MGRRRDGEADKTRSTFFGLVFRGWGCVGDLIVGDRVNCERALAAHTRFGGHFVQVR